MNAEAPKKNSPKGRGSEFCRHQGPRDAARREQGREHPGTDRLAEGSDAGRDSETTSRQAHSVRGFLSTAAKKHAIEIESAKSEAGDRVYQVK